MRKAIFTTVVCIVTGLASINVYADRLDDFIQVAGCWGGRVLKSASIDGIQDPAQPSVSFTQNVLSIYFTDAISNLEVAVVDPRGGVVFQELISGGDNSIISIPLEVRSGTYVLLLSQPFYGELTGKFSVGGSSTRISR
ncbi:hypothetical protein AGMMS49574_28260 [Bacteroidia bacterium]|nr:hypothetical protein AGMMS49574_28260 [Bacteroidia bacterium]